MKSSGTMTIQEATASYEAWLGKQLALLPDDLERKHELMRSAPFPFLRATHYRWAQLWPQVRKPVRLAREVLAVGDLHVECFGTWRDAEGRLVWGIDDFDEACRLPYTYDLVRLASSARLAIAAGQLAVDPREADSAILSGYKEGLEAGGRPIVLTEHWSHLSRVALAKVDHPDRFWKKLTDLPTVAAEKVPDSAVKALGELLPAKGVAQRYVRRVAGAGSLGRQRFVVLADWCGGPIAREAKAVAQSAVFWANRGEGDTRELVRAVLGRAVRCPDPWVAVKRRWVVRRLAPDCSRMELADLPREHQTVRFLYTMGWEAANVHLGSASAAALLVDLVSLPEGWLPEAVEVMVAAVQADWEAWQEKPPAKPAKRIVAAKRKPAGRASGKAAAKPAG